MSSTSGTDGTNDDYQTALANVEQSMGELSVLQQQSQLQQLAAKFKQALDDADDSDA